MNCEKYNTNCNGKVRWDGDGDGADVREDGDDDLDDARDDGDDDEDDLPFREGFPRRNLPAGKVFSSLVVSASLRRQTSDQTCPPKN